jgi:protein SCO1/2
MDHLVIVLTYAGLNKPPLDLIMSADLLATIRRLSRWLSLPLPVLALLLVAGCGGSASGGTANQPDLSYSGIAARPAKPAPPLHLRDSLGRTVDLRRYKGKAVLLTFIYTHCPDTCPLIVSHLRTAQAELGPAARHLQIIAVSTDPRGDTPKTVATFLRKRGMSGRMEYLIGSRRELGLVWKAWDIVAKPRHVRPRPGGALGADLRHRRGRQDHDPLPEQLQPLPGRPRRPSARAPVAGCAATPSAPLPSSSSPA